MARPDGTGLRCAQLVPNGGLAARGYSDTHPLTSRFLVGARGFEPLASSASRKRSTPELSAREPGMVPEGLFEAGTGIEPV